MNDRKLIDMTLNHILDMYQNLTEDQQRIFDLGELYGKIVSIKEDENEEEENE